MIELDEELIDLLKEGGRYSNLEAYIDLIHLSEVSTSILATRWQWSRAKVHRFIALLTEKGFITIETSLTGTKVTPKRQKQIPQEIPQQIPEIIPESESVPESVPAIVTPEDVTFEATETAPSKYAVVVEDVELNGDMVILLDKKWHKRDELTPVQINEAKLMQRKIKFWQEMKPFYLQYPDQKEELDAFFSWATEANKSRTKMKKETYPTWCTSRRIQNWFRMRKNDKRTYITRAEQNAINSQRRDANIAVDIATTGADAEAQRIAELKAQGII